MYHLALSGAGPTRSRNYELKWCSHSFWSNAVRKTSSGEHKFIDCWCSGRREIDRVL